MPEPQNQTEAPPPMMPFIKENFEKVITSYLVKINELKIAIKRMNSEQRS